MNSDENFEQVDKHSSIHRPKKVQAPEKKIELILGENNLENNSVEQNDEPPRGTGLGAAQIKKQSFDSRHPNLLKNLINKINSDELEEIPTTWDNCKYKKSEANRNFCRKYTSICSKEKCNKAVK